MASALRQLIQAHPSRQSRSSVGGALPPTGSAGSVAAGPGALGEVGARSPGGSLTTDGGGILRGRRGGGSGVTPPLGAEALASTPEAANTLDFHADLGHLGHQRPGAGRGRADLHVATASLLPAPDSLAASPAGAGYAAGSVASAGGVALRSPRRIGGQSRSGGGGGGGGSGGSGRHRGGGSAADGKPGSLSSAVNPRPPTQPPPPSPQSVASPAFLPSSAASPAAAGGSAGGSAGPGPDSGFALDGGQSGPATAATAATGAGGAGGGGDGASLAASPGQWPSTAPNPSSVAAAAASSAAAGGDVHHHHSASSRVGRRGTHRRPHDAAAGAESEDAEAAREAVAAKLRAELAAREASLEEEERALRTTLVRAGFLTKQGHRILSWRRRWFQLQGQTLSYFVSPRDAKPKGETGQRQQPCTACPSLAEAICVPQRVHAQRPSLSPARTAPSPPSPFPPICSPPARTASRRPLPLSAAANIAAALCCTVLPAGVVELGDFLLEKAEHPHAGRTLRLCNTQVADRSKDFVIFADTPQDFVQWVKAIDRVKRSIEALRQKRAALESDRLDLDDAIGQARSVLQQRRRSSGRLL